MKVVIFGTGNFYQKYKDSFKKNIELTAFIDNDPKKWGKMLDGIRIYPVEDLDKLEYDIVFLLSASYIDMKRQLRALGVPRNKIYTMQRIGFLCEFGESVHWYGSLPIRCQRKKILVFSHALTSTGAQNVLFQAVQLLKKQNFEVVVASGTDGVLRTRLQELDIPVVIIRNVYAENEEIIQLCEWADLLVVNTLLLYETVIELMRLKKPLLWWIHETGFLKKVDLEDFVEIEQNSMVSIYAVSPLVKRKITEHYGVDFNLKELCYGLPDYGRGEDPDIKNEKMIFAHIAAIAYIKGQDLLLKAVSTLPEHIREKVEFWFVGPGVFSEDLLELSKQYTCVEMKGEIDNTQMKNLYCAIDVVMCVSREDALPVVVAEGCMMRKTSIVSNATGIAEFLDHKKTGLIFESENVDELSSLIQWAVEHKDEVKRIGENSRRVYDTYFSMNIFEENLLAAIGE